MRVGSLCVREKGKEGMVVVQGNSVDWVGLCRSHQQHPIEEEDFCNLVLLEVSEMTDY